ncbi:DUF6658 family protein [Myxosarcina sp. GI1]|uniref:DUF6658 family protein n=1 Tax=Myxosarcina sp. GI1 TaxID=1541065 RepID=UPI000690258A|nr:DUF6658 family protein [Myxosarcina sp. GI1]
MQKIANFSKKLRLSKLLTTFVLGIVILFTTACNSGNDLGARPENPPVQLGGQNNPHKGGGDDYTQYKVPTDPRLETDDRASLLQPLETAIATDIPDKTDEGLLYPNTTSSKSLYSNDDFVSPERKKELLDPKQIPAPKQQPNLDRSDPNARLLEKTGQMFEDASDFLPDLN